jgi:hypothetical protein
VFGCAANRTDGKVRRTAIAAEMRDSVLNELARFVFVVVMGTMPAFRHEYSGRVEDEPRAKAVVAI